LLGEEVGPREEVLRRGNDNLAVARCDQVMVHTHELRRLHASLLGLRHVEVHLVAIEVGIVRRADALVETEGAVRNDACAVGHDGQLVEGGLSVEEDHIAVGHVPLDRVTNLQLLSDPPPVAELEGALAARSLDVVGPRPLAGSLEDGSAQIADVGGEDLLRVSQDHGDAHGDADLVDGQVGVRRDDRPT